MGALTPATPGIPSLPVTDRTRHRRLREQGSTERGDLDAILTAGVICHLGVVVDGYPMVVPTVYGLDGDTLYLHGSVASRSLVSAPQATVCVTVTHVDGLVLARSVLPCSRRRRCRVRSVTGSGDSSGMTGVYEGPLLR